MIREKLGVHKQYLVISAPVPFKLIANNGTDFVQRSSGIWQLDCYKLLPEKFMKNYPVFNLELEYDETLIPSGFTFEYYFTNLNLGDSLKGVSGDLVELSESQINKLSEKIKEERRILLYENENFDYGVNTIPTIPIEKYVKSGVLLVHSKNGNTTSFVVKDSYLTKIQNGGSDHGMQYIELHFNAIQYTLHNYTENYYATKFIGTRSFEDQKYIFDSDNIEGHFSIELIF